jgi:hypothetical protein
MGRRTFLLGFVAMWAAVHAAAAAELAVAHLRIDGMT